LEVPERADLTRTHDSPAVTTTVVTATVIETGTVRGKLVVNGGIVARGNREIAVTVEKERWSHVTVTGKGGRGQGHGIVAIRQSGAQRGPRKGRDEDAAEVRTGSVTRSLKKV